MNIPDFFNDITLDWLLIDFFALIFGVYLVAFLFTRIGSSTRLEAKTLKGYLTGLILHMILTVTFIVLVVYRMYNSFLATWQPTLAFASGFIVLLIVGIILTVIVAGKLNNLPDLGE